MIPNLRGAGLRHRERHVLLLDGRRAGRVSADVCRREGAWIRDNRAALQRYRVDTALLLPRAYQRFATSMVFAIASPPFPSLVCTSMIEALDWLQERLAGLRAA